MEMKFAGIQWLITGWLLSCRRIGMYEQTDFSTFSAQKAQKGRYSPKNAIKGERNGAFPKRAKKGRHLWERVRG